MRCTLDCCEEVFACPDFSDTIQSVPLCPRCGAIARPNVLLYGEGYSEKWYRADTAGQAVKGSQVLIVIGTQLKCGFPTQRVKEFAVDGRVIIEINVEPVIEYGNVLVLTKASGEVVPNLVKMIRNVTPKKSAKAAPVGKTSTDTPKTIAMKVPSKPRK